LRSRHAISTQIVGMTPMDDNTPDSYPTSSELSMLSSSGALSVFISSRDPE
jgi:hypothetical protein